jgi:outer membrane cobalamin receptor
MVCLSRFHWVLIVVIALGAPVPGQQARRGSISGTVVDEAGAVVGGARVMLRRAGTRESRLVIADDRGAFRLDDLAPDEYLLSAEAEGLSSIPSPQRVRVDGEERATITLAVSALQDAVVVTATRTETRAAESPSSVHVISAGDLERATRPSVLDALRGAPGATIAQTARRGGVTSLFVRGGESDYTKVLVDGIPVNDAGGAFDLSDLTVDNAERIELVRGAQSALYGSDAMTGVLKFITRRGTSATPELELSLEGGSFGFARQWARLSGAAGAFDYAASFGYLRTNGRDRNDDYQNRTASANLGYRFSPRTSLRLTARRESSGLGAPGATAVLYPDPDERARRRRLALGARFEDQTTSIFRQSLSFAYAENNQSNFDPAAQDLSQPLTPPDTFFAFNDFVTAFNNHQRRRAFRYQSDLSLPFNNLVSAGVEYERERAVFDSGFGGRSRVLSNRTNIGFFVQDQLAVSARLVLTAGLRLEHNRAEVPEALAAILASLGSVPYAGRAGFGTKAVPKAAAVFFARRADQGSFGLTKLRASYGEGIKAPTLVEAFSPDTFFLGNPALRPERSRSYDLGIEQLFWRERVRAELTWFENRFRDQIAFVGDPATFGGPITTPDGRLTNFVNFDRAYGRGVEFSLKVRPARRWELGGHYTYLDSKVTSAAPVIDFATLELAPNPEVGQPLLRRPRHSGAFNVSYGGERFDLHLDGYFVGRRRDLHPLTFSRLAYNDPYARVDLSGAWRFNSRVAAFARIENLLNRDYQEVLGYPAYRLNFSAGLRFRIGGEK